MVVVRAAGFYAARAYRQEGGRGSVVLLTAGTFVRYTAPADQSVLAWRDGPRRADGTRGGCGREEPVTASSGSTNRATR